jgi:hypothetical protein
MICAAGCNQITRHTLLAFGLATLATVVAVALGVPVAAHGDSTPVGALPAGPVTTITTSPNQLVAVALQRPSQKSGLVWRIARQYDSRVVREVSEADVGPSVVLIFKVLRRGKTSLVFAQTRGDTSGTAVKSATHKILSQ